MGGGPYEVIRDGVDGLLARNKAEWRDNLRQLAASPQMREELAGRARERVLTEYDVHQRAAEWADAFRWAAEHAGRGLLRGLTRGLDRAQAQEMESRMESEARANLAHRRVARTRSIEERETLARLRGDRDVCWPEEDGFDRNPLVTVRIATYNRGRLIVERSIKSALAQTYRNIEILVVGDCATPETVEAVSSVKDSRLRFVNLPERGRYPAEPENRWMVAGSVPMNYARGVARGAWIAPLDDDDEITPDHVKLLVGLATEHRLEFMYGLAEAELPDGSWSLVGAWPPVQGGICHGSIVYSSKLDCFGYDEESYRQNEPADWNRWRRMIDAGVRMGRVEQVVYRHYAEARHRDQAQREPSQSPIALLEARS